MKQLFAAAILVAASGPAWAQSATAIGTGVGVSKSTSKSEAVAISGQGGAGGTGVGVANGGAIAPSAVINNNATVPTHTSVSTVPSVFAPGLAAAGIESCLGSVSGGGSWLGTGITLGGSIPDKDCSARLDARTLWSMGLKKAAVARLCQTIDIRNAMPDVCGQYLPAAVPAYAPAVLPTTYASAEPALAPGQVMLVEGKTGKDRLCNDYDEGKHKCRLWADANPVHRSAPKKVAKTAAASAVGEIKAADAAVLKKD